MLLDDANSSRYIDNMTRTQLDPNLKHAVSLGTPVEVIDPSTNELFYLVSAEQFRKNGWVFIR